MKLKEFLETLKDDREVSIGALNGSGYVFIGKASDTKTIKREFEQILENTKKRLNLSRNSKAYYEEITVEDYMKRKRIAVIKTRVEAEKLLKKEIENLDRLIERCEKFIGSFVDPLEREVYDHDYIKDTDDTLAVIISGLEFGKYWTKDEVK